MSYSRSRQGSGDDLVSMNPEWVWTAERLGLASGGKVPAWYLEAACQYWCVHMNRSSDVRRADQEAFMRWVQKAIRRDGGAALAAEHRMTGEVTV